MAMNIGDKVKFLNDVGGGVITRFLDPEKVLVKIEEGFEVPAMLSQLILDVSDEEMIRKQMSDATGSKEKLSGGNLDLKAKSIPLQTMDDVSNSGLIFLAFTHEGNPFRFKTYLINDSNYHMFYVLGLSKMNQQLFKFSGSLESNTKIFLEDLTISKPDEKLIYTVQLIGYRHGYYNPRQPTDARLEIDAQKLTGGEYEAENDFFNMPASLFIIDTDRSEEYLKSLGATDIQKIVKHKDSSPPAVLMKSKKAKSDVLEVDLHIHELLENEAGLSDGEKLEIQVKKFKSELDTAIEKKLKKIVFIHGVGQGRLKQEISRILDQKYPDLKYQDASFKEYGYGATMVMP